MLFTLRELIDIIIMTAAVGFIFKDMFKEHGRFMQSAFWFACAVTAPALILHELAHKFVALAFGLQATFHAHYTGLGLGIVLKLINFNFIFFIPGYVSIEGAASHLASALIAVAGPAFNLILFIMAWVLLKQEKLTTRSFLLLQATKQINLFLFIFNMLPIPRLFDGWKFYEGIFHVLFG
ncbi:M50 family metallopeptidase [Candidatus Woesearchaeota archaeon]|nr:M50 family metallopeptidase [Candidatus Woesearchaeota archaeon]